MGRFLSQLGQVLVTYRTRKRFWWVSLCVIIGTLLPLFDGQVDAGGIRFFALWLPIFFMFTPITFWVDQLRFQFCHPRARLMPGFATPHLIAPAVVFASLILLPGLVIGIGNPTYGLQLVSIGFTAAAVAWLAAIYPLTHWLLVLAILAAVYSDKLGERTVDLSWSTCIGMLLFAALVWLRFAKWTIELQFDASANNDQSVKTTGLARTRAGRSDTWTAMDFLDERSFVARSFDSWHARLTRPGSDTRWRIIQRFRLGFGPARAEFRALIAVFVVVAVTAVFSQFSSSGQDADRDLLIFAFGTLLSASVPGALAGEAIRKRRAQMSAELLWPMSREQFISRIFSALRWDAAVWWCAFNAATIAAYRVISGPGFDVYYAATYLGLSLASAVALFGLSVGTAHWKSSAKRIAVLVFAIVVQAVIVSFWLGLRDQGTDGLIALISLCLLGVGWALAKEATRSWSMIELG